MEEDGALFFDTAEALPSAAVKKRVQEFEQRLSFSGSCRPPLSNRTNDGGSSSSTKKASSTTFQPKKETVPSTKKTTSTASQPKKVIDKKTTSITIASSTQKTTSAVSQLNKAIGYNSPTKKVPETPTSVSVVKARKLRYEQVNQWNKKQNSVLNNSAKIEPTENPSHDDKPDDVDKDEKRIDAEKDDRGKLAQERVRSRQNQTTSTTCFATPTRESSPKPRNFNARTPICLWDEDLMQEEKVIRSFKDKEKRRQRAVQTTLWCWRIVYAILACLELMSCLRQVIIEDGSMWRVTVFGYVLPKWTVRLLWRLPSWFQLAIDRAFVVALVVQSAVESWRYGSQFVKQRRSRQSILFIKNKGLITNRTQRRRVVMETTSRNRHFIQRWTNNLIRWDHVATKVLGFTALMILLRLLFVPVFEENPMEQYLGGLIKTTTKRRRHFDFEGDSDEESTPLLSVAEAVVSMFHSAAVMRFRKQIRSLIGRCLRRVFLVRPWRISRRIQRIFRTVRWAKFLAPLIGTCNKFRGNFMDYSKKRRQRQQRQRARQLWDETVETSFQARHRKESAIRKLQRKFRRSRQDRMVEVVDAMTDAQAYHDAAACIQRRFRTRLSLVKHRMGSPEIKRDRRKLAKKVRRKLSKAESVAMNTNPPLLMLPNTSFAVRWRRTTVTCVLLEIIQILAATKLAPKTMKKVPVDELVAYIMTQSVTIRSSETWMVVVAYSARWTAQIVSTVSFLDVFITFFTGEISNKEKRGRLVPKPWFTRWILPGVALQLVVNPTMKDIAWAVQRTAEFCRRVGPLRVLHIGVAILPLVHAGVCAIMKRVSNFVKNQNKAKRRGVARRS